MKTKEKNEGVKVLVSSGVSKDEVLSLVARFESDACGSGEEFIKRGSTCVVGVFELGRKKVLVKRFNYKGRVHAFFKKFTESRAKRLFSLSRAFSEKKLPVPEALACVEMRKVSYFISEYAESIDDLGHLAKKIEFDSANGLAEKLAAAVARFHESGCVHGDLKWTNILVTRLDKPGFYFIDLDQAHLFERPDAKGMAKDLANFIGYGKRMKKSEWVSAEFLPAYRRSIPAYLDSALDYDAINLVAKRSYENWKKRSGGR